MPARRLVLGVLPRPVSCVLGSADGCDPVSDALSARCRTGGRSSSPSTPSVRCCWSGRRSSTRRSRRWPWSSRRSGPSSPELRVVDVATRRSARTSCTGSACTHRGGPPPIPPDAPNAHPLRGKHLRSAALAVLARSAATDDARRDPPRAAPRRLRDRVACSRCKRLADALGYETAKGSADARRPRRLPRSACSIPASCRRPSSRSPVTPAGRERGLARRFGCELDAVAAREPGLRRARGSPGAPARPHPARASGSTRRRPTA